MIRIQNLSFGYGRKKLLYKDLELTLRAGNIYGLLGKNGAGKSTLLKSISGLLFPKAGTVTVYGHEPQKRRPAFLQTIYLIPEEVYVPSISVKSYLKLFAPFYPAFNEEQFYQYLKELEVSSEGRLGAYSFGQQKKFIIAFALACNTPVLLLDEPTNGLDIPSKTQFRKLIASVMNEDRIIFISTHQTRDLENLIDNVLIVDNGQLLLNAPVDEIGQKLAFKTLKELPAERKVLLAEDTLGGIAIVEKSRDGAPSRVNLEQLFNAVTLHPAHIKAIFSNKPLNDEPNF